MRSHVGSWIGGKWRCQVTLVSRGSADLRRSLCNRSNTLGICRRRPRTWSRSGTGPHPWPITPSASPVAHLGERGLSSLIDTRSSERDRRSSESTHGVRSIEPSGPGLSRASHRSMEPRESCCRVVRPSNHISGPAHVTRSRSRARPRSRYQPQVWPLFCSSSHFWSGAKYSRIAVASMSREPVSSASVSCHGWLAPFSSSAQYSLPASLLL